MPTPHPNTLLAVTATQIREEIAEYERLLATIPREPELPDNELARAVLYKLIRERHAALDTFDQMAVQFEHSIDGMPTDALRNMSSFAAQNRNGT